MSSKKKSIADAIIPDSITKPVIRKPWNSQFFKKHYEKNDKPSETQPDQAMPIKDIYKRYVRGLPLNVTERIPLYEGEEDLYDGIDPRKLDIATRQEYLEEAKNELNSIREKYQNIEKDKRQKLFQKQQQEAIDAAVRAATTKKSNFKEE